MMNAEIKTPAAGCRERPILFKGEMVRAILDGRKTQTRRIVKPQPPAWWETPIECHRYHPSKVDRRSGEIYPGAEVFGFADEESGWVCDYGAPGDRLWVKETFGVPYQLAKGQIAPREDIIYRANPRDASAPISWKPSIFMRREYSRLNLEITAVWVERLQDISPQDAEAEGIPMDIETIRRHNYKPVNAYRELWETINGKESWAANPWVWVIEFRKL